jgi:hypothetical protein
MSEKILFDQTTALAKVGLRVRTVVKFSGVPRGTAGRVIRADARDDGYTLAIEWELPERHAPLASQGLVNWFTKSKYERFLVEL